MEIGAVLHDVSGFIEQVVRKRFCYLLLLLISCAARNVSATRIFANAEWGETAERNFKRADMLSRQRRWCSDSYHKPSDLFKCSSADLQLVWRWKQQTLQSRTRYQTLAFDKDLSLSRCHGNGAGDAGCYIVSWVTTSAREMVKLLFFFPQMSERDDEFSCCRWWTMVNLPHASTKSFICNITIYFTRVVHRAWTKIHPLRVAPLILRGELGW